MEQKDGRTVATEVCARQVHARVPFDMPANDWIWWEWRISHVGIIASHVESPCLLYSALMRQYQIPADDPKGWLAGPWESNLPVSIGYASVGVDEPHVHPALAEVYLVARGTSRLRVGSDTLVLAPGIVVVVEAGEPHTFLASSKDYMHFVLHIPAPLPGSGGHKIAVDRSTLGL